MAVTESRSYASQKYDWYYTQGGFRSTDFHGSGVNLFQTGDQTTTSYRTGARSREGVGPGDYVSTSGSQIEFARELHSESEGDLARSLPDNGHEFSSTSNQILWPSPQGVSRIGGPNGNTSLTGAYLLPTLNPVFPPMSYPSSSQRTIDGTKLISMTIPTAPEAGLAQFLGELRERLPELVGSAVYHRGLSAGTLGEEHLNIQFGIRPFISDLQKLARSVINAAAICRQMKRDSDRTVRRRASLSGDSFNIRRPDLTVGVGMPTFWNQDMQDEYWSNSRTVPTTVEDNYHSEVWFSGAYQYHLYDADSFIDRLYYYEQLANHLLGTRLTADLVWELTPWSRLVDWDFDIGRFFHNVDAFSSDNLVLRYGYVMHRTSCTRIYSKVGLKPASGASAPNALAIYLTSTKKERMRATPYGFGVDVQALSPSRQAILAALGLTRAPGGNLKFLN